MSTAEITTCERKKQYKRRAEAAIARQEQEQRNKDAGTHDPYNPLVPYSCAVCGQWHIGHTNTGSDVPRDVDTAPEFGSKIDLPNPRAAWLAERRTGLGGSDAAAVCGLSKWRTPLDVYLDKIGESEHAEETEDMRRGKDLEPYVLQRYADETGFALTPSAGIVRCEEYPFMLANYDALALKVSRGVDAKTAKNKSGWGEPGTAEVPLDYLFQCQHYMIVSKLSWWDLAAFFGTGFEFAIYPVPADLEFQEMLIEQERDFWLRVEAREPPEPINLADVQRRWPQSNRRGKVAPREIVAAVEELRAVKEKQAALEELADARKMEIQSYLAGCDTLLDDGGNELATWRSAAGAVRFDAKRFAAEHPDLAAEYQITSAGSRRFLLK